MNHIGKTIENSQYLQRLRAKLSQGGAKSEILALLSAQQKSEILSIQRSGQNYVIKLRRAYALYGIRHALNNFHHPVKVLIDRSDEA